MSPDGEAIVTGAGDETLRFWNVFSKARSQKVEYALCLCPPDPLSGPIAMDERQKREGWALLEVMKPPSAPVPYRS